MSVEELVSMTRSVFRGMNIARSGWQYAVDLLSYSFCK